MYHPDSVQIVSCSLLSGKVERVICGGFCKLSTSKFDRSKVSWLVYKKLSILESGSLQNNHGLWIILLTLTDGVCSRILVLTSILIARITD